MAKTYNRKRKNFGLPSSAIVGQLQCGLTTLTKPHFKDRNLVKLTHKKNRSPLAPNLKMWSIPSSIWVFLLFLGKIETEMVFPITSDSYPYQPYWTTYGASAFAARLHPWDEFFYQSTRKAIDLLQSAGEYASCIYILHRALRSLGLIAKKKKKH